jgi:Zn finger protein HypA/HybF involved in hydrogenase expression
MEATKITESDYLDAVYNYTGWCTSCKEFTRDSTEPDAEGYNCPECEQNTVVGAENALIAGLIVFVDDDEED